MTIYQIIVSIKENDFVGIPTKTWATRLFRERPGGRGAFAGDFHGRFVLYPGSRLPASYSTSSATEQPTIWHSDIGWANSIALPEAKNKQVFFRNVTPRITCRKLREAKTG